MVKGGERGKGWLRVGKKGMVMGGGKGCGKGEGMAKGRGKGDGYGWGERGMV